MGDAHERPRVLIEEFMPVKELGIESNRERSASSALPPMSYLHVWWARRPLTVSRASILASMLPADTDHGWFLKTLGIMGDPIAECADIQKAKRIKSYDSDGYSYKRAYKYTPPESVVRDVRERIGSLWGQEDMVVLDPMAGGGSIPFEAMRYGFDTYANELNPVAAVILEATLRYPAQFGPSLAKDIRRWADELHRRVKPQLAKFYPKQKGEKIFAYVWARTVKCPNCDLQVPLSPNWWLEKSGESGTAVRVLPPPRVEGDVCAFEIIKIVNRKPIDPNDTGTVTRGTGRCPRCNYTVEGGHIKAEAQAGRMGEQMYAIVHKTSAGKGFRAPNEDDTLAAQTAYSRSNDRLQAWEAAGFLPSEAYPAVTTDSRPIQYGMPRWYQMFTPRQLLSHVTHVEALQKLKPELLASEGEERGRAIITYLAFMFDKSTDYNSRMVRWHSSRGVTAGTFDRHDFSFKWSHGEFDHADMLWPWATSQVVDAYEGLAELAAPAQGLFDDAVEGRVHVDQGDAAAYRGRGPESVDVICVDPPYYDNVMYAECSDFFYVWQKRTLGDIYPEWFDTELTDKDREAVANVARFAGMKGSKKKLAEQDYEAKMRAVFNRCHTVLKPHGVMTMMFTHKRVEAWDTLAAALIAAGFEITAAWPVHTESEHSLHQAKKNACSSTILLVCRKRPEGKNGEGHWWDDVEPEVRAKVREKVQEFEDFGMEGVDLMVSTFGPALQVISSHWPVRDKTGKEIRPDVALDEARRVVVHRLLKTLVSRSLEDVSFDPPTQWTILAWELFKAARFPYDEGRKLAMAVGVSLDDAIKRHDLAYKQSQDITLREPKRRVKRGTLKPDSVEYGSIIDAIHAAIYRLDEDGVRACREFLVSRNLIERPEFIAGIEALLKAIPQARAEWHTLREVALAFYNDKLDIPEPLQLPGLEPGAVDADDSGEQDADDDE